MPAAEDEGLLWSGLIGNARVSVFPGTLREHLQGIAIALVLVGGFALGLGLVDRFPWVAWPFVTLLVVLGAFASDFFKPGQRPWRFVASALVLVAGYFSSTMAIAGLTTSSLVLALLASALALYGAGLVTWTRDNGGA